MSQPAEAGGPTRTSSSARDQVGRSMLMRLGVIPVAGACGLLTARVVVSAIGVSGYGIAALVATLPALLPSADLGVGAAVTSAVAAGGSKDDVFRVVLASLRVLLVIAGVLVVLAVTLATMSMWSVLLGLPSTPSTNWAIGASVALFGLSLPLAIGARVLLGGGRNHISVLVYGLSAPVVLLLCLIGRALDAGLWLYAAAPAIASLVTGLVGCRQAMRRTAVDLGAAFRQAFHRQVKSAPIRHIAGPMAVISACLPLAYQSDRLVLSHVSTVTELAIYSAGAAMFAPLLSVISSGGQSLWPIFVRARLRSPESDVRRPFLRAVVAFVSLGLASGLALVVFGPWLGTWMLRSQLSVPVSLMASLGLLLVAQASCYPPGMLLTDPAGLRFQAKTASAMLLLNIPLSVLLASHLGAPGPVLGSVISIAVCLWLPGMLMSLRRLRRPTMEMINV